MALRSLPGRMGPGPMRLYLDVRVDDPDTLQFIAKIAEESVSGDLVPAPAKASSALWSLLVRGNESLFRLHNDHGLGFTIERVGVANDRPLPGPGLNPMIGDLPEEE